MSASRDQSANDRAKAAYLGLAIGDALGVTVEFMTPNEIQHLHGVHKNIVGGGWLKLKSGMVTDDTQMSLALGSALLSCAQVDARVIAESFSEWMRSKPIDIGNTVRRGLIHYRTHGETSSPKSEYSAGNGACMRCLPIALASLGHDKEMVRLASRMQAHITHHADLSDAGTEHIIELVQMAIRNHSLIELEACSQSFVRDNPKYRFDNKKISNPSGFIVETLQVVLQCFYSTHDFESCLIEVVNRGGDADTTGAIAGMLAGAFYGLGSLPQRWRDKLDQEIFRLCESQAEKLLALAPIDVAGMGVL